MYSKYLHEFQKADSIQLNTFTMSKVKTFFSLYVFYISVCGAPFGRVKYLLWLNIDRERKMEVKEEEELYSGVGRGWM